AGREGVAITLAEPREHRQLQGIERATRQKIEIARLPTVADLRARRLELTRAAVREAVIGGDLDQFRVVVESLADEFDVMQVALAAVKLAHRAEGPTDEEPEEIPEHAPHRTKPTRARGASDGRRGLPSARGTPRRRTRGDGNRGAMARLFIG